MREIVGNTIATPNPQPDWAQTDKTKADYIKNKPTVLTENQVKDLIDKFGGDTQIPADWTQTDTTAKDYIQNKPTLGSLASKDEVAKSDLSDEVQEALGKADSAIQSYTETDPTVPDWAKAETKPSYGPDEVGALPITGGTLTGELYTSAGTPLFIGNHGKIGVRAAPPENQKDTLQAKYREVQDDNSITLNHVGQINVSNAWWNKGEGETQDQWGAQMSGFDGKEGRYHHLRVSHEGVEYSDGEHKYQVLHSGDKGVAGGVAELNDDGKVPSEQLPDVEEEVLVYTKMADFPKTGEAGKIYIASNTLQLYIWRDSSYITMASNGAYAHSQLTTGNPHNITLSDLYVEAKSTELNYVKGVTSNIQDQLDTITTNAEEWTFTLEDGTTVKKVVYVK